MEILIEQFFVSRTVIKVSSATFRKQKLAYLMVDLVIFLLLVMCKQVVQH